jgi:hypothetical protein
MTWLVHGRIQGGAIVLPKPLPLPDGTEVTVRIERVSGGDAPAAVASDEFASVPFFGMWADRADMADSARWVRGQREQWQQRTDCQDSRIAVELVPASQVRLLTHRERPAARAVVSE